MFSKRWKFCSLVYGFLPTVVYFKNVFSVTDSGGEIYSLREREEKEIEGIIRSIVEAVAGVLPGTQKMLSKWLRKELGKWSAWTHAYSKGIWFQSELQ